MGVLQNNLNGEAWGGLRCSLGFGLGLRLDPPVPLFCP